MGNTNPSENKIISMKRELRVNGTSVWFNFGDQMFLHDFFKWMEMLSDPPNFKKSADKEGADNEGADKEGANNEGADKEGANNEGADNKIDGMKELSENLDKLNSYSRRCCEKFDELFGSGTCEKIFGCKMPTIDVLSEFINFAIPLINECTKVREERQKQMMEEFGNRAKRRLVRRK